MRRLVQVLMLAGLTLAPAVAFAQASLAGQVQDSSGGVLPGVTVEAASPALIEKVANDDHRRQWTVFHPGPATRGVHR